jgi:hypothetical protein
VTSLQQGTCSAAPPMKSHAAQLAKYASKRKIDLTEYHSAREELRIAMGSEFSRVDTLFAREVLTRLRFNKDVGKAVAHAWKSMLATE